SPSRRGPRSPRPSPRGKVRLSMRVVDQETGAEIEDTRPAREERPRGEGRGDRGPRRDGDGGRPPRSEGGGGGRGDGGGRDGGRGEGRGPRRDGDGGRGPRRDGGSGGGAGGAERAPRNDKQSDDDGPAPEFAPAFLTGDRD
ncbi:MAG: hypothetical protein EOP67_10170, partial [Sphingomonas sp.]